MSCGGVRSPGEVGRSPGAYDAGPLPQSSVGGSGTRESCSVMLTLGLLNVPRIDPNRALSTLAMSADNPAPDPPPAGPAAPVRLSGDDVTVRARTGLGKGACPQGLWITPTTTWTTRCQMCTAWGGACGESALPSHHFGPDLRKRVCTGV